MPENFWLQPGMVVYLHHDLGDWDSAGKRNVVVPAGTPATISEFVTRTMSASGNDPIFARLNVPRSPGQKLLTTPVDSFRTFWTFQKPKRIPPVSWWDVVSGDDDFPV
jgi:hypothetical protein